MGSLRNPIGPLPSSIYWRRRAVALAVLVAVVLLVVWAVSRGGSGGGSNDEGKGGGPHHSKGPSTITPGPTPSGPIDSSRPGGRDEASGGPSGGGHTGRAGQGGTGGGAGGAGGAGGGIGVGDGRGVPAGSSLPDCTSGSVEVTIHSVHGSKVKNSYEPGQDPTFEIEVKNTASGPCKVDFGHAAATLTITDSHDDHVWASDDCPHGGSSALVEVPGGGQTKRTVTWDRKRSAAHCATPSGRTSAKPGTYLVEVKLDGVGTAQTSFVLDDD